MENHGFIRLECIDGAYCQKQVIRFHIGKNKVHGGIYGWALPNRNEFAAQL